MNGIGRGAFRLFAACAAAAWLSATIGGEPKPSATSEPLEGTRPLELQGDIASQLVAGADEFLLRETAESVGRRARFWSRDLASAAAYDGSISTNRQRLGQILVMRDPRRAAALELVGTPAQPALVGRGQGFEAFAVRWSAFGDVHGEGLLLAPTGGPWVADVVAIPDATQVPEQIAGLVEGVAAESQFARRLAESGCRVLIPVLINRQTGQSKSAEGNRGAGLSNREFLYRSAFELGRHLIGYEVQKVLAGVDWFHREGNGAGTRIGVIGWGEGGMLALYAGALDPRIEAVGVSGYFDRREDLWQEPIDRNVFGLLEQFGGAEVASMVAPRGLVIEAARGPELVVPTGTGGGPGRLSTPALAAVRAEIERARQLTAALKPAPVLELVVSGGGAGPYGSAEFLTRFLVTLASNARLAAPGAAPTGSPARFDPQARHQRQMHELDRHSQQLLAESPYVRQRFMSRLDTKSVEQYQATVESYRDYLYNEVIGRVEAPLLAPNARSRRAYEGTNWAGYEVVLDVFPGVIAYGILLVPNDVKPGDRRPVVVCQHGLEGRPQDTIGEPGFPYYKAFAAQLAERGFVTFAPQNLYIFTDRFRSLQRKANPLKQTLFSIIVPQHQQITDWLKTLPWVDPARIAFYGLSYGGKTAMRVPPLVKNYFLSICSADFNEWVWKNASTLTPYSYVWSGEYEIFEFDLGSTFNYAEMAALIAPRPFMVERGHFDGVAPDETVGYEFAKVRFLYEGRLGLGDRCELEWFTGPHTINGKGTFDFLHRHLEWPRR